MSNIKETIWNWLQTAPPPVMLAISLASSIVLGGWIYALDSELATQKKLAATQNEAMARVEAKLDQVGMNLQTLLKAVLWENKTSKQ